MGILKFDINVLGLRELRRKCDDPENELLAKPWAEVMEAMGDLGQRLAAGRAPHGPTGRTASMLYHRVQQRPLPLWVRVGTKAKNRRFGYPKLVHWTGTRWLLEAVITAYKQADPILKRAAQSIQERWSR